MIQQLVYYDGACRLLLRSFLSFFFLFFSFLKGIALDSNGMSMPSYQSFLYQNSGQHQSGSSDYGQPVSPTHSPTPTMMSPSQSIPTVHCSKLLSDFFPFLILLPNFHTTQVLGTVFVISFFSSSIDIY